MACGSVLVTGANKGIGLEFVRQLVESEPPPQYVFATYRNKETTQALEKIKESSKQCKVVLIQMDVTKKEAVQAARKIIEEYVGKKGLNLLINNAGQQIHESEISDQNMIFHFKVNTLGPFSVFKEMLPLLQLAAESKENVLKLSSTMVLNMATRRSSVSYVYENDIETLIPRAAFLISKTALNMLMRNLGLILSMKNQDILIVNMSPGSVKTHVHSNRNGMEPSESISSMLKTLPTLDLSRQGDFMDRYGKSFAF